MLVTLAVFVGAGGLIEPRALGVGYDIIGDLLKDNIAASTTVPDPAREVCDLDRCPGISTSGGVLAPILIFGGCAGWLEGQLLPGAHGAWVIGMAAMMGGTMRSSLTAILFAVELTGDFAMLGPLLIATSAAYALTVLLLKRSSPKRSCGAASTSCANTAPPPSTCFA
ncbi:chloride channel protein [Bradyrhizobium liaoningense]|uniref:chloride channel protein n=1 Tax=Bradyrhizobium liaoningense TaxID=43992 RepID=UPI001BA92A70|nr:chloride channel protein [Bradyrhizobium liaoningense]MBR0741411.1 chloride channel protein [Bradyrhizobium liaoningense]